MAILWSAKIEGNSYEVRSAGRTVRLYINGVFHSQHNSGQSNSGQSNSGQSNSGRVFGGGLWDLLSLPVFFSADRGKQKVLILGLGGGAVLKQLGRCLQAPEITAVDIDPVHLQIAEKWFDVSPTQHRLYCADAVDWLSCYQGSPFDYIVDDLFAHDGGVACRAVGVDNHWAKLLLRNLNPNGTLVVNYADKKEALGSELLNRKAVKSSWFFSHPRYHNCVCAHLKFNPEVQSFSSHIIENKFISRRDRRMALALAPIKHP